MELVEYPIAIGLQQYRGANARKRQQMVERARLAQILETHINKLVKVQTEPIKTYDYSSISRDTGLPLDTVQDICFSIDCGHNGLTAAKPGLTVAQALELMDQGS
jgi:hypothetical protein